MEMGYLEALEPTPWLTMTAGDQWPANVNETLQDKGIHGTQKSHENHVLLAPSCTEDVPKAQKKPTTKGSPKYNKTTQGLDSKGLQGNKTNNLKTTGVVHSHPKSKNRT